MIFPFRFNKDETDPALKFPDLAGRGFSFNISVGGATHIVRVSYNVWTNNGQVSIYDAAQIPVALNIPLIAAFSDGHPNFLYDKQFAGYSLAWDPDQGGFIFGET